MLACLSIFTGCKENPQDSKKKAVELMSTQTLGLAYLEEFKLDEAEKEFLKFIKMAPTEKLGYANLGLAYLRMAKYPEAKKQLTEAIKIDPKDPDIRLLLATVYEMNDEKDKAISELREALTFAPDHIKILYDLSELYSSAQDDSSLAQRKKYTTILCEKAPANLVPQLNLTEILIRDGEPDKAYAKLEDIKKQFPEFPKEAVDYYNKTLSLLKKKDKDNAFIQFTIFHNYMKVTSPYQAGIMDVKGPGGSLIGFPLITYDQQQTQNTGGQSILETIKFTDATASSGLGIVPAGKQDGSEPSKNATHVEIADYDADGDPDIYVGSYDNASSTYKHYLFNNEMNRFRDVAAEAGIKHTGNETDASFSDFDNDGFLDLYIVKDNGDILYRNVGKGSFEEVSKTAKIGSPDGGTKALFYDMDHDGDLDMYETRHESNLMFRNNGDATFQEQAETMGLSCKGLNSSDAIFGDFDDDGDIDLLVVNQNGSCSLFSNQRQGAYKDITNEAGLGSTTSAFRAVSGDYNNDGFPDLFFTSVNGSGQKLMKNKGNGTFEPDTNNELLIAGLRSNKIYDAAFFDFDNDGYKDLIVAGIAEKAGDKGVKLFHNDGKGNFSDVSNLLPADLISGSRITLFDYNNDGDQDVIISGINGGITLLRNDGGNNNHYVKMTLVGLRAGSAKNNRFGIGAKVEMRAGDLYQSMIVTYPEIHFGLGNRKAADVIRITWTNGVPQNVVSPNTDQALVEAQTLKGSCPFLFTWNGSEYVFVKDVMWRSALGMPLGIMGGNTAYAFPDASDDYLTVPGDMLKPKDGNYSVQITSELWETMYYDKVELIAVDHPASSEVFVPEQFTPPPFPGNKQYIVNSKFLPVSAEATDGSDVLEQISAKDDNYLNDFTPDKYQGTTSLHTLTLDPGKTPDGKNLYIFLNGWIFPTDASINMAMSQSDKLQVTRPCVQVINKKGEWETVIPGLGFPMGKNKTVVADLTGIFPTKDHRIRICTNMEIYWDYIFFSDNVSAEPVVNTAMRPSSADIHYRGFSMSYRKGGRYGPHWFDYNKVDTNHKWRDLTGNYTRYGDVLPLLEQSDNKCVIANAGDETTLTFDASTLPELKEGWKRDFLIHTIGWVKDGDMNTALGNTVAPLPYHGMKSYPPSASDKYPDDEALKQYQKEYNTRVITGDEYRSALRKGIN